MGGFTSFIPVAMQALSVAGTIAKGVDNYRDDSGQRAYEAAKAESNARLQALEQRTSLEKSQNDLELKADEDKRQRILRQAIAKQRSIFAANGIGSGSGSSQAYLLGLAGETDFLNQSDKSLNTMRNTILEQNLASQKRINTLLLSQNKNKSGLKRATALYQTAQEGYDGLSNIFGGGVSVDKDGFYS